MNIDSILKSVKNNSLESNYLLCGEEPFFIEYLEKIFLNYVIPKEEKTFNEKVFYGKDIDIYSLINSLKAFPMIGDRQLIVVRDAQYVKKLDEITNYLNFSSEQTILVLSYKQKVDKRKKWVKLFQSKGIVFDSKKLYPKDFPRWIKSKCVIKKVTIEKKAEILLIEALGYNLLKISNSIDKLSVYVKDVITALDVEKHIGVNREYNNFELQNAIGEKDIKKSLLIVNYFTSNTSKYPIHLLLGMLFSFFSKLLIIHSLSNQSSANIADKIQVHPYFAGTYLKACNNYSFDKCVMIISHLKDAEIQSKGLSKKVFNHSFLKELIFKVIY